MVEAFNCKIRPEQTGPLFEAVGAAGIELTLAVVDPAAEVQPLTLTVTLYVPVAAVVALLIYGF